MQDSCIPCAGVQLLCHKGRYGRQSRLRHASTAQSTFLLQLSGIADANQSPANVPVYQIWVCAQMLLMGVIRLTLNQDVQLILLCWGQVWMAGCITKVTTQCLLYRHPPTRSVLATLVSQPQISSVRQDMLPYLTQQQFKQKAAVTALSPHGRASTDSTSLSGPSLDLERSQSNMAASDVADSDEYPMLSGPMPGANYMEMTHSSRHRGAASSEACSAAGGSSSSSSIPDGNSRCTELKVHLVDGNYCARVCDVQAYAEVCREVGLFEMKDVSMDASSSLWVQVVNRGGCTAFVQCLRAMLEQELNSKLHIAIGGGVGHLNTMMSFGTDRIESERELASCLFWG